MKKIIAINPGATSTKIAYYQNKELVFNDVIRHELSELEEFPTIAEQLPFRYEIIKATLLKHNVPLNEIDAVVGRGGVLPPTVAGAYEVNDAMLDYLANHPRHEHASNLGAAIANDLRKLGNEKTKAYIYDSVTVDQYSDVARISGLKGVVRESIGHALNARAVAIKTAKEHFKSYEEASLIVAHLGGGNSITLHHHGKMIDSITDDQGPFSMERTGGLPIRQVIDMCYEHTKAEMMTFYRRQGGVLSYLGTNDLRKVEEFIEEGNQEAELIFSALIYQIAKGIGSLATVLEGKIDGIILTGGLANSDHLVQGVQERTSFIAPIFLEPGEHEMQALSEGVLRVLNGEEEANVFYYND